MSTRLTLCNSILTGPKPVDLSTGFCVLPGRPGNARLGVLSRSASLSHCVGQSEGPGGGGGGGFTNDYSLSYDGSNDYAQVTGLSLSGATSFSLWWNGQEATPNTTFPLLHQDSSNIFIDIGNNFFRVYLYDGTNAGYIYRQHNFVSPTQGKWYHFGITYDGTTNGSGLKTYIDGSLTGSGFISGTFNSFNTQGSNPLLIGARLVGPYAQQLIDEVAIFNSELSATNISDIYNGGNGPTDISSLSPKHWWRMGDSDTGVSNGSSTPTIVSNVASLQNNYALDFDGTNHYLDIDGIASSIDSYTNVSWSGWYKGTDTAGYIFRASPSGSANPHIGMSISSNSLFGVVTSNDAGNANNVTHQTTINDGSWHHLAVTFNGTSGDIKVYVDGVVNSTTPNKQGTPSIGTGHTAANIGRRPTSSHLYTAGLIDEFAIFNSELSAANITAIYNNGQPTDLGTDGLNLNPQGWWRIGDGGTWDGSNWSIPDASNNSNAGTTVNMFEADRVTDTPTANAILTNGPTYSSNVPT